MAADVYTDVPVSFERTAQGDHYQAFVTVDGAKVALTSIPAPEFEMRVQEAAEAAAAEAPPAKSK